MIKRVGFAVSTALIRFALPFVFVWALPALGQEDEMCFFCHADPSASKTLENGQAISLYVDASIYGNSIHGGFGCVSCHADIAEVPHEDTLEQVNCGGCHSDVADIYATSLHGKAIEDGDPLAPSCPDCHGKHDIRALSDPESRTNPINIPGMCGGCHAEDAPVARSRDIQQHHILEHYEQSIHGEGILRKGLTVTAVCSSCHTAH